MVKSQSQHQPVNSVALSFQINHTIHSSAETQFQLKNPNQGHGRHQNSRWHSGPSLLTHTLFVPCLSALPFLRYHYFKIWPCKSKVKVIGEVKVQGHIVGPASYQLRHFSFHVDLPCLRYSYFKSWKSKVKVMCEVRLQGHIGSNILFTQILFDPCQSSLQFLIYSYLKNWPWESNVKVIA